MGCAVGSSLGGSAVAALGGGGIGDTACCGVAGGRPSPIPPFTAIGLRCFGLPFSPSLRPSALGSFFTMDFGIGGTEGVLTTGGGVDPDEASLTADKDLGYFYEAVD